MSKIKVSFKFIKLQLWNALVECSNSMLMLSAGKWRTLMYHRSNSHLVHSAFIKAKNHINQESLKVYQVCLKGKNALEVTSCTSNLGGRGRCNELLSLLSWNRKHWKHQLMSRTSLTEKGVFKLCSCSHPSRNHLLISSELA